MDAKTRAKCQEAVDCIVDHWMKENAEEIAEAFVTGKHLRIYWDESLKKIRVLLEQE